MKFRRLLAISLTLACALALGCRRQEKPADRSTIPVGIVTSVTGAEARFGQAQKYGYDMALDEINATGVLGKKLELIYQDDASKPEIASLAVEKLTEREDIPAIIGAYSSSATFPAAAVAKRHQVAMLCPCATAHVIKRGSLAGGGRRQSLTGADALPERDDR